MNQYEYYKPKTLKEASGLFNKNKGALYIAGGTDLLVQIRNRDMAPTALISLRNLEELQGIEPGSTIKIGAATSITDIALHRELAEKYPVLIEASKLVGSAQIRNAGTIGGNICNSSPCADMVLALLVLDATVRIQSETGSRDVEIGDFFLGPGQNVLEPGEILSHILLPKERQTGKHALYKKGRVKMDLAIASVAVLLEMDGPLCKKARVSAGSVAPTPLRLTKVENLLEGNSLTENLLEKAVREAESSVSPICDVRSTDEYRRHLVGVYLRRGVRKIMGWNVR